MRIALIGDIHGNLHALEAVLEDMASLGVETVWNMGDMVGYGAYSDEVVTRLREEKVLSILGNYDKKVLRFKKRSKKWKKKKRKEKWLAFKHAYENLSEGNFSYLRLLPEKRTMTACGHRFLLCHGSPDSSKECLDKETSHARLRGLAATCDADVVVCAHSHRAFREKVNGVWFVNTGTVGRPVDGDPRACYCLAELEEGTFRAEHRRIDYDIDRAAEAILSQGLPPVFAQMVREGIDFPK